ncbi:hypothetical protein Tco_0820059 [Tanacetum coccineum]|uniref:Uncharacterized protein n=1 Tax=Tanacetum coccineum TaxID=301880 RepID=A0ABQ5A8B6_9ASTR
MPNSFPIKGSNTSIIILLEKKTAPQQAPHTVSTIKLPILKKGEYDIWAIKMEHYLAHTDYPIWEVIQKGNGPVSVTTDTDGEDHLAKFHKMTDAKDMWEAMKSRFGGNDEYKKMQEEPKALVTIDGEGVDWTSHSEKDEDYALMACNNSESDTEREQLSDASIEIKAHTQGLKKVEAQLVAHQQCQLCLN